MEKSSTCCLRPLCMAAVAASESCFFLLQFTTKEGVMVDLSINDEKGPRAARWVTTISQSFVFFALHPASIWAYRRIGILSNPKCSFSFSELFFLHGENATGLIGL